MRVHVQEQDVFEDDATFKQPDVVIKRTSYKNNLKFDAERLEGHLPSVSPDINQLIRDGDSGDDARRRRRQLDANEIFQRNVGSADDSSSTTVILSPRSEAYRAPNKAKPLPDKKKVRYIPLTPERKRIVVPDADKTSLSAAPPATPSRTVIEDAPRNIARQNITQQNTVPHNVPPSTNSSRIQKEILHQERLRQELIRKASMQSTSSDASSGWRQNTPVSNARTVVNKRYASPVPADSNPAVSGRRSNSDSPLGTGASTRLLDATGGYPTLSYDPVKDTNAATRGGANNGEELVYRDIPESGFQRRLDTSGDEYLKLAPPELWEDTIPAETTSNTTPGLTAEPEPEPILAIAPPEQYELPVRPSRFFDPAYVWGTPRQGGESNSSHQAVSEFAFGLPWEYLSKGWQIPSLLNPASAFSYLWFVVDLHQSTRSAFEQRIKALTNQVDYLTRRKKLELLEAVLVNKEDGPRYALSAIDRLTLEQRLIATRSELTHLEAVDRAGMTPGEHEILNVLEGVNLKSMGELVRDYRIQSLEYRFYKAYFERLKRPGFGMSARLPREELDALAGEEMLMQTSYRSFHQQQAMLEQVIYDQGRLSITLNEASSDASGPGLLLTVLRQLDKEQRILKQRLMVYRDLWMVSWHVNQFVASTIKTDE